MSYLIKAEFVKYGFSDELHKKKQTGTVAMAGKTAGGIRVCLDLFCLPAGRQVSFLYQDKKENKG